jgi:hypothetical protein
VDEMGLFRYALPALAGALGVVFLHWITGRPRPGIGRCQASIWVTGICLVGGALFSAGLVAVLTQADSTDGVNDGPWLPFILGGFSALLLWGAADALFRRIEWDERKVLFRKLFSAPRTAQWSEIATVHYRPFTQTFRIGLADGTGFVISEMVTGLREFLADVERYAPAARPGGS